MLAFLALSLVSVASLERGASGNVSGSVGAVQAHLARCSDGPCPSCATPTCDESVGGSSFHRRVDSQGEYEVEAHVRLNTRSSSVRVQVVCQADEFQSPEACFASWRLLLWCRVFPPRCPALGRLLWCRVHPLRALDLIFAAWYVTWRPKQHLFVSASGLCWCAWMVACRLFAAVVFSLAAVLSAGRVGSRQIFAGVPLRSILWVVASSYLVSGADAVTCHTCHDQLEGCAGGANCPFLSTPQSNMTNFLAAGAAGLTALALFPREWMTVVSRAVLDSLMSVARRPLSGAPLDLANKDVSELAQAFKDRTAPRNDVLYEIAALIPGATEAERAELKLTLDTLKMIADMEPDHSGTKRTTVGEVVGVLMLLWALAGKISDRASNSVCVTIDSEGSSSSTISKLSEKMKRSTSLAGFCERISVFSALAHGLGVENTLGSVRFFKDVAYDPLLRDKLPWQLVHELVVVYLEDVDNSLSLNLGNIFDSGAQDTRMARAKTSALKHYPDLDIFRSSKLQGAREDKDTSVKFNGKSNSTSDKFCLSFNLGGQHSSKHLSSDGSCKFKHACDGWITGAGPKARCNNSDGTPGHCRKNCDHPNRSDTEQ